MKSVLKTAVFSVITTAVLAGNAFAWAPEPNDPDFNRPRHDGPTVGVPEPGTLGLMGIGLLAAGLIYRRRK